MGRGSRLAVWAGLVALSAALVTVVLAVLVPGGEAGADKGGGGHCAKSVSENGNGNGQNGNGHKKSHSDHGACSASTETQLVLPSSRFPSFPSLTAPARPARLAPARPSTKAASQPPAAPPSVQSVPQSRTNLTVLPSRSPTSTPAPPRPAVTVTTTTPAASRAEVIEPVAYPASHSSVTLPGTLAAFALAVAGVVAVSGYRRRGALLAGRRPGPGGGPRHGQPRGRHSRR
ncbi:MAG TPA: hypothetical protein VH373_13705 [Jatrophihabitantaceae bacterium]|jgi:hypothetical protein